MVMTIAETLARASQHLRDCEVPNDVLDAQTLLGFALGKDRTYLIINFNLEIPETELTTYWSLIERRANREPLQYITGRQEFFGLEFEVTPDVLIPRPETELIVEEAIRLAGQEARVILDLCTGSGCVITALARELENARAFAGDISPAALLVARRNAKRHGVSVAFFGSDLFEALDQAPIADLITCNPPYIAANEVPSLQVEVRDWEPELALTDHDDGLSFYRRLFRDAPSRLKPGGSLICEMGYTQADAIFALVDQTLWAETRLLTDLQGIPRTIVLKLR
jgi:release factor glutamine methyltransferase